MTLQEKASNEHNSFKISDLSTGAHETALIGSVSALKRSKGLVSVEQ